MMRSNQTFLPGSEILNEITFFMFSFYSQILFKNRDVKIIFFVKISKSYFIPSVIFSQRVGQDLSFFLIFCNNLKKIHTMFFKLIFFVFCLFYYIVQIKTQGTVQCSTHIYRYKFSSQQEIKHFKGFGLHFKFDIHIIQT